MSSEQQLFNKTLMFIPTEADSSTWPMDPSYQEYFNRLQSILAQLRTVINMKWAQGEKQAYLRCLTDLQHYISEFILTNKVVFYQDFTQVFSNYGHYNNPVGYNLYVRQLEYLDKRSSFPPRRENYESKFEQGPYRHKNAEEKKEVKVDTKESEHSMNNGQQTRQHKEDKREYSDFRETREPREHKGYKEKKKLRYVEKKEEGT